MSMPAKIADIVDGQHGLRRTSPSVVACSVTDWWYEAQPAIAAAMRASFSPLERVNDDIGALRSMFSAWAEADEAEWLS